jgi:hypothetical protein
VPPSPVVSLFSLLTIPLVAYSSQYGRSSFDAPVAATPQYYMLSSASAFLATITFGFMWFSRLPTTTEILMGIFLSYGQSQSFLWKYSKPQSPCRWLSKEVTGSRRPHTCSGNTGRSRSSEYHNVEPRVAKNLLFPCAQFVLHDDTNVIWYLDE